MTVPTPGRWKQTSDDDVLDRQGVSLVLDRSPVRAMPAQAELGALLLVACVFLGWAWLSWRRLGSLIVDGGHELDVPRRIVEGAALYRDFSWNWGPLAPWVNAGLSFQTSFDHST